MVFYWMSSIIDLTALDHVALVADNHDDICYSKLMIIGHQGYIVGRWREVIRRFTAGRSTKLGWWLQKAALAVEPLLHHRCYSTVLVSSIEDTLVRDEIHG